MLFKGSYFRDERHGIKRAEIEGGRGLTLMVLVIVILLSMVRTEWMFDEGSKLRVTRDGIECISRRRGIGFTVVLLTVLLIFAFLLGIDLTPLFEFLPAVV